jgi:Rieske Fe-S protein
MAIGFAFVGFGRWAWAQVAGASIRYAPLTNPVRIPLQEVATPWRPAAFVAEAMAPATSRTEPRRVLIHGVVFRRASQDVSAVCVTCPHEQCQVDLVTDRARLSRMGDGKGTRPLFECGCHLSLFDADADGARISGETPRGLYRFRIGVINQDVVEIDAVEEVALVEV